MPALSDGRSEAVNNMEKANMCVKVFQEVHNSKSLGDYGLLRREEILRTEGWKLNVVSSEKEFFNVFFSLKELKQAVQAGAKTTPGQDSISYELLKHLDDVALEEVLALSNYVWEAGVLPKVWKHAVVVPVLKPGKDPSCPSSYRPIALTAVLCKVMERMVTNRLVYLLETKGFFCELSEWV